MSLAQVGGVFFPIKFPRKMDRKKKTECNRGEGLVSGIPDPTI